MQAKEIKVKPSEILKNVQDNLYEIWLPSWYAWFKDTQNGGFHERLDEKLKSVDLGYRRLVTQCRQLFVYSHAALTTGDLSRMDGIEEAFDYLVKYYYRPETGGWRFSVKPDGTPVDDTYDLYGHAFLVLCCTYYYRLTQDETVMDIARRTLDFINTAFRVEGLPGFAEALDEDLKPLDRMRRQDPHMHLFEASLFMYRVTNNKPYLSLAKELADLFTDKFWSRESGTLPEYYDDFLNPHPESGHISQPGHHFQWIWLLEKFQETRRRKHQNLFDIMSELFVWADKHGFDPAYGGIYDELDIQGDILTDSKRIWPIMEALKAYPVINRLENDPHYCTRRAEDLVTLLRAHYLEEDGRWTEQLSRDMKPLRTDMPGTTPYHIYLGIAALSEIE